MVKDYWIKQRILLKATEKPFFYISAVQFCTQADHYNLLCKLFILTVIENFNLSYCKLNNTLKLLLPKKILIKLITILIYNWENTFFKAKLSSFIICLLYILLHAKVRNLM